MSLQETDGGTNDYCIPGRLAIEYAGSVTVSLQHGITLLLLLLNLPVVPPAVTRWLLFNQSI